MKKLTAARIVCQLAYDEIVRSFEAHEAGDCDKGNRHNESFFGLALQAARCNKGPDLDANDRYAREYAQTLYRVAWDDRYSPLYDRS